MYFVLLYLEILKVLDKILNCSTLIFVTLSNNAMVCLKMV
jgi:hypothetical protein